MTEKRDDRERNGFVEQLAGVRKDRKRMQENEHGLRDGKVGKSEEDR